VAFSYRGAVAVVTGASSGIGAAIARDLASRGTTVVACARRREPLERVVEKCRRGAPASEAVVCDVGEREQVEGLVRDVLARHGRIDVLVNNAGIPMRVHATRLTAEQVERVMRIDFLGAVWATLAALPSMLARRSGHIVNVSSVAGRLPSPREAAYTAAKHALAGWTETLAVDLEGTGVRAHLVNPGPIRTEIWEKVDEPPAYRGRMYPPEGVAAAVRSCLERDRLEVWYPRRLAPLELARILAPRAFVRSLARYDRRADRPAD
jgi:NAD(P)-dependent dehydrogenase (short-subunit alcohol dehydrogenase family)